MQGKSTYAFSVYFKDVYSKSIWFNITEFSSTTSCSLQNDHNVESAHFCDIMTFEEVASLCGFASVSWLKLSPTVDVVVNAQLRKSPSIKTYDLDVPLRVGGGWTACAAVLCFSCQENSFFLSLRQYQLVQRQ